MDDVFEAAKKDPGRYFSSPDGVLTRSEFTSTQKIELLKQWEADVREKMVASDEGMSSTISGRDAELLKAIKAALERIGADGSTSAAVNKAGG